MSRWLLVLALLVVNATASAQPEELGPAAVTTDAASTNARLAERRSDALAVRRNELAKRYQDELEAIDRLKYQRASWRRDRELRDRLSRSLETANQLSTATRELERAKAKLATARRAHLAAIDRELVSGGPLVRAVQLKRAKAMLAPQVKDAPRHIVIPDLEVDLLADPEELDQRAAELRESEEELNRQLAGLRSQAAELDRVALLRKQHDRAGALVNRDDDQPHRSASRRSPEPEPPEEPAPGHSPSPLPPPDPPAPMVRADVIDASPATSLSVQRSGDPAQRAEAAHKAREAVARRLEQVRKRRTEIEARARALRER